LSALIDRAAGEVHMSYRDQHIDMAGPTSLQVLVDADRTVQILVNIMDNAAKYSSEGSGISVGWERDGLHAAVRVRDHGAGVSEVGREHLFTRFGRVPGSQTRQGHVGTGLGLYLGRGFARAMGGELELESTGPDGSVFCLRLRLA
jgi:histidine kinase